MNAEPKLHALEISLTVGCRLACKYCPQKLFVGRYFENDKSVTSVLAYEDFKVALDKVQPNASISFCGMSEPFHNPECADMIKYAYEKGYKISLLTTLVGMTMEDFEKIKDIKFDSFVLHIPDEENHSKFNITPEYLELLKKVNEEIKIDYYSCHGHVHPEVKGYVDETKYAGIALGDRAGNLDVEETQKVAYKSGKIVCYHGSEKQIGGWSPVMLPDGRLVLCCMDYGMKHVLGNLITQSWEEIEKGDEYQRFKKGLEDESVDLLCRNCSDARKIETLPAVVLGNYINNKENLYATKNNVIRALIEAKEVAVFGLGKLFRDHFEQEYWNVGLNVKVLSDNNKELHGKEVAGAKCVSPEELANMDDVAVVIFVKAAESVKKQLKELGLEKVFSIDEIMDAYIVEGIGKSRKITL